MHYYVYCPLIATVCHSLMGNKLLVQAKCQVSNTDVIVLSGCQMFRISDERPEVGGRRER